MYNVETPATETSAPAPQPISASEMVSPLVNSMPIPTSDGEQSAPVVSTPEPPPAATASNPAENVPDIRDNSGQPFDPSIHMIDEAGNPRISKAGTFMRKRGPKPGATYQPQTQSALPPPPNAPPAPEMALQVDAHSAAAEMYLNTFYGVGAGYFGKDFLPDNREEHEMLKQPLTRLLREKQVADLPAGWALTFAAVAYISIKYRKPTIQEKMGILFHRVKSWFNKNQPEQVK